MGLVWGVGYNDLGYSVAESITVDGKSKQTWRCLFYFRWKEILRRASRDYHRPTYAECEIAEEWINASEFKAWMESQHWEGNHLDKDILVKDNKVYGPDTCAFIPAYVNTALLLNPMKRKKLPLGVKKEGRGYRADINLSGSKLYLGNFKCQEEAHAKWQGAKIEQLVKVCSDYKTELCFREDVLEALIKRVDTLRYELSSGIETKSL